MERNVYREYKKTVHYQNRTGVRATCPDCHAHELPKGAFEQEREINRQLQEQRRKKG